MDSDVPSLTFRHAAKTFSIRNEFYLKTKRIRATRKINSFDDPNWAINSGSEAWV